ncbi:MAG: Gfo/Idh/MocA family oxidoreductase [Bacteroidota bacterium]|nr:Gfo/Idh/MocA family oxidoreductase [Bacteroidota bacterium]MDP4216126.1 Gfo/Idh/MocA family oxidoreductase [Bacteroidota bacterium]MDP4252720.1 Gfo/Idh/MocA family oxidoreductase [Bacteroidota bacterium]MDP4260460.1 Gfo/Idh/MocA family oxidoreductase [Bacteroidota bacterium]
MNSTSRRNFISSTGLAAAGMAIMPKIPAGLDRIHDGKKLNVALVGLGRYAGILADGLQVSRYCRLAGVVTGHPAKAAAWKAKYGLSEKNIYNYENFDAVAGNPDIDLIYVVLPNALHKEFTVRAAKARKHVICEKPMAVSSRECLEMIEACSKAGVQLAIGYRLHYEPYNLEMRRLGQEKVFGTVRYVEAGLGYKTINFESSGAGKPFDINDPSEWRLNRRWSGGGALMNLGVYCLQASRYILGENPLSVTAQYGAVHDAERFAQVEEAIVWQARFPGGAMANCNSSYGYNIDGLHAIADNGFFELSPAISYGPFKGRTSHGDMHFPEVNQQAAQLDGIGKLILENKPLPDHISGKEGLADMCIMEAIYKAADTGSRVDVVYR